VPALYSYLSRERKATAGPQALPHA